jgi:hypothetical protein
LTAGEWALSGPWSWEIAVATSACSESRRHVIGNGDMVIIDTEPFAGKSFTLGLYALQMRGQDNFEGQVTRTIKGVRDSKLQ